MTPDEVEAIKTIEEMREGYHKYGKTYKALTSAITQIQDYQKLRERVSVEKISGVIHDTEDKLKIKKLGYITFIDNGGNKIVRSFENFIGDAIVTYLQQPTEHIER